MRTLFLASAALAVLAAPGCGPSAPASAPAFPDARLAEAAARAARDAGGAEGVRRLDLGAPGCGLVLDGIDALASLEAVSIVTCGPADYRALGGLPALRRLTIDQPALRDTSFLYRTPGLTALVLTRSDVVDLRPVALMPMLERLTVLDTPLTDLAPLADAARLTQLDLTDTYVRDLSPLAGATSLETLRLARTRVRDLTALTGLTRLVELDLSGNGIGDVAPLAANLSLGPQTRIDLTGNCLDLGDPATEAALGALTARGVRLEVGAQMPTCDDAYFG